MKVPKDYLESNKKAWNQRMTVHVASKFYDNEAFINGKSSLNEIELNLLGDISGKSILHLQCHFGQDSISLARMGAQVTGVDLSDKAIEKAVELASVTKAEATFICCDVYSLPKILESSFDLVFTSYGTIGWLPDVDAWAKVIAHFLKPGGRLVFAEFHPFIWMYNDDFQFVKYSYFNDEAIVESLNGTYAQQDAALEGQDVTWNHPISEVLHALIANGLALNEFKEYNYSPYNCFNQTIEFEPGKFRIKHWDDKIPMVYALTATKSF